MIIHNTPEMDELEKIYEPYEEGCHLKSDAPAEAVEAFEKYLELFNEAKRKWIEIELNTYDIK